MTVKQNWILQYLIAAGDIWLSSIQIGKAYALHFKLKFSGAFSNLVCADCHKLAANPLALIAKSESGPIKYNYYEIKH